MTNPEITIGRDDVQQPESIQLRQILRNRYGIVLLGLFVLLLLNATIIHVLPTRYQAAIVIEDSSGSPSECRASDGTTSDGSEIGGSPVCFPQTPFEVLTSEKIISQLSRDLDLPARFQLPEGPAVGERVRGMVRIEPIGGTDLFQLIVTDTEETRAIEIANGIYRAYEKVREKTVHEQHEQAREVLDKQLKEQEERVFAAFKKMEMAMKEADLVYISTQEYNYLRRDEIEHGRPQFVSRARLRIGILELEAETLRTRINNLQDLERNIRVPRKVIGIEEEVIQKYWPQLQDLLLAEEQAERLGIGPNHPDRMANRAKVDLIQGLLRPVFEKLRTDLKKEVSDTEKRLQELRSSASSGPEYQQNLMRHVTFSQARQDYYDQKDILLELREEIHEQWLTFETPPRPNLLLWSAASSAVRVHPYLPHKLLHPILGVIIGLILGGGLVFLAARRWMLKSTT